MILFKLKSMDNKNIKNVKKIKIYSALELKKALPEKPSEDEIFPAGAHRAKK